jgi:uncharacterized protein YbjT (DUF2867 family)
MVITNTMEDVMQSTTQETHLVTGAFGYSGSYIARELLAQGHKVRTLTRSPDRHHEFGDQIDVWILDFNDRFGLIEALTGVRVLYNTYWVRFPKAGFSQDEAVRNSIQLFEAARDAGVERIVHVSITNPSLTSPYSYFRGKAEIEAGLEATGVPHSILRPAVLFGGPEILHNNIAWMLRHLPVFGIFGKGEYRLRPIHVQDLARLALEAGSHQDNDVIDAVGPETFTFRDLVRKIGEAIGKPRPLVSVPRPIALAFLGLLGLFVRDVILTKEEIGALMDDLLVTDSVATGKTRFSTWLTEHANELGQHYASELARRRDRQAAYSGL